MEKYEIEKIRNLPIESVARRLGLNVTRHKTLCPFHADRHPSLTFSQRTNTYRCFVCDAHGDTITLAMHLLHKPFVETCRWLANESNILLTEYAPAVKQVKYYPPDVDFLRGLVARPFLNREAEAFLFEERHLSRAVVEWCGISSLTHPAPCWRYGRAFYDAPSLLIPYRDILGEVQNVQSRYLGYEKGIPRFRFPANSSIHIFNLPILRQLRPGEPLYIAEGITDCLALLSAGHKAIAIPSATLLKKSDLQMVVQQATAVAPQAPPLSLHIYPDHDEAGERLYQHLLQMTTPMGCTLTRHNLPQDCKDFSDYYVKSINIKKQNHGN